MSPDHTSPDRPVILVVDEDRRSRDSLRRLLEGEFEVLSAASAAEAEALLAEEWVQVILCDQRMPGETGASFLRRVRERWPEVVRMIISGYADAEDIINGIHEAGIYQYITKPWNPDSLLLTVRGAVRLFWLQRENDALSLELKLTAPSLERAVSRKRGQLRHQFDFSRIVRAEASPMNRVCELAGRIARFDISVLITGESGTGKELLARAVHYNSARAEQPFVVQNCGALPDQLLESELFGYKRGAFTGAYEDHTGLFAQANGGSIFLDEIGEISPCFQVKLLRVLQEGEIRPLGSSRTRRVDVRVIAATNRDLERDVRQGRFREDLYYRLAGFTVEVPPLRARSADVPLLGERLLTEAMDAFDKPVRGFQAEAMQRLCAYHWPGNVRELRNEVQRMLALSDEPLLGAHLLSPRVLHALSGDVSTQYEAPLALGDGNLKERIEHLEKRILQETLIRHRWNKTRAAEELGLSRVGLRSKLQRYGLEGDEGEDPEVQE